MFAYVKRTLPNEQDHGIRLYFARSLARNFGQNFGSVIVGRILMPGDPGEDLRRHGFGMGFVCNN